MRNRLRNEEGRRRWALLPSILLLPLTLTAPASPAGTVLGDSGAPRAATVLGTEIHTRDPEETRYWILRTLTDRYAAEKGIVVAPEEIDAYVEASARAAAEDRKQRDGRRQEIEGALASATLSDAERKALSSELELLTQLQRDLDEMSGGDAEETRQARRTVAAAFIRQWKINQALYREYGGRVIFQQGGPEPLDAYRRFLEEQQKQGAFDILDGELEKAFWSYYTKDNIHSFYPAGSDEEKWVFETPWWLTE